MMPRISMKVYLGIDPGASGGLAEIGVYPAGGRYVKAVTMPATLRDLWDWIGERGAGREAFGDSVFAVIEKVGGYVSTNGPQPGSAMFKFGASYGALCMALTAAEIPYEEITPAVWQRGLGIHSRGSRGKGKTKESRTEFKNRLKAAAQRLFPKEKVTLATADALLIAEYCRRFLRFPLQTGG